MRYHLTSVRISSVQFSHSVVSDSLRPHGVQHTKLPFPHHLPELAQVHAQWICDANQPSHPLLPTSPPSLNAPSTASGSFKCVGYSYQVAKVLELQLQNQSLQWFSSVHFSHSVVSDSLRPHEWQQTRPPIPSPTHGVHSDSRPSSQWCHPAISTSTVPFSSCPQSLPASESVPMS